MGRRPHIRIIIVVDILKKTLSSIFILGVLYLHASNVYASDDNTININQVGKGDDLELTITQEGFNNDIFFSIGDGDDIVIDLKQVGNYNEIGYANDYPGWGSGAGWGGDVDYDDQNLKLWQNCTKGSACNKNDIQFHVSYGTDNKLWWAQGFEISSRTDTSWSIDNTEGGGHNVTVDIHGSNNEVVGQQRNCAAGICDGHSARIYVYGDDNSVFGKQKADGQKEFYLTINNDDNTVDYLQDGNGAHNATITLDGNYGTTLNLTQHTNTLQNYTLTQNCQTSSGCSVTVTQD
jgi:VCBS repeat-containing protein